MADAGQKATEARTEEKTVTDTPTEQDQKITKDMTIVEVITEHPDTMETLIEAGLHCVGCYLSPYETIEMGTLGHGWEEEDMEALVQKLNEVCEKEDHDTPAAD